MAMAVIVPPSADPGHPLGVAHRQRQVDRVSGKTLEGQSWLNRKAIRRVTTKVLFDGFFSLRPTRHEYNGNGLFSRVDFQKDPCSSISSTASISKMVRMAQSFRAQHRIKLFALHEQAHPTASGNAILRISARHAQRSTCGLCNNSLVFPFRRPPHPPASHSPRYPAAALWYL
jgi:hypothetical protein